VIIYALGSPDRKRLLTLLSRNPEPEHVQRYIQGTDAIESAKKKAIAYANKAKGSLIDMEKGKYSDALVDLADYVVERSC
jgi:geranylgeranyl pyrophosphate synthase